mgnify:CR=1 FL=1
MMSRKALNFRLSTEISMIKTLFAAAAASLLAVGAASAQTTPAPATGHEHPADHHAARPTIDSTIEASTGLASQGGSRLRSWASVSSTKPNSPACAR